MKTHLFYTALLSFLIACNSSSRYPDGESIYEAYAPDGIPFVVADSLWTADMQGNHRAVVSIKESAPVVIAELPWRRPDLHPETKKIKVVNAVNGTEIKNVSVRMLTSEKGIVAFEAPSNGEYYIYYLPYKFRKQWHDARYGEPWNDYLAPEYEADPNWEKAIGENLESYPKAQIQRFESRTRFDFFTSMGTIATREEMDHLYQSQKNTPVLFTEDRAFPIRLKDRLPYRWIKNGPSHIFRGEALLNEYYVWQIGVWAVRQELKNVKLLVEDFVHESGKAVIDKSEVTCFNQEGINWNGDPVSFTVDVPKDQVQALWCGIQIPAQTRTGKYKSEITVTADNITPQKIQIEIEVKKEQLADKGDSELWRHARLRWLNSTIGDDNLPVAPYTAMSVKGKEIDATGKQVSIGTNGLPESIIINEHEILSAPLRFVVETNRGTIPFEAENVSLSKEADGLVSWNSSSSQNGIDFRCEAFMEYDGYIRYYINVSSKNSIEVNNIQLITTYSPYSSEYFMGTGFNGGYRPVNYQWDWKGPWDSYWMGGYKAGLHMEFRGGSYHGPLINDYKPAPPQVWANEGKGTVEVSGAKGGIAKVVANTGKCNLSPESKTFEFSLLITPVKPVDSRKHFSERYYHSDPKGFDKAAEEGTNIINIHHAQQLNPVINYPFIVRDSLIDFIEHQHRHDRKVKLYYTIRELTNHTAEIYALKSLNHEIFVSGVGYGIPWFCEHLIDDYKPAWYTELPNETSDAALVLNGFSRWINYYLEGLRWMFENYEIDGIYMDDVSFDRNVMKRMRKIMAKYRPNSLIDLHSNTGYSIGPANQYTDFFPYVDRLWFGESFKYNEMTPDEWFVTFSGIPFGLMSEMLQDGGNRFLGMVYGATARHSYGQFSPAPVWKLWKDFGIEEAQMIGYWDEQCPVTSNKELVKATAYVKPKEILCAVANFDDKDQTIRLSFDWDKTGIDKEKAILYAPYVEEFQQEQTFKTDQDITIEGKKGLLLILMEKDPVNLTLNE